MILLVAIAIVTLFGYRSFSDGALQLEPDIFCTQRVMSNGSDNIVFSTGTTITHPVSLTLAPGIYTVRFVCSGGPSSVYEYRVESRTTTQAWIPIAKDYPP
jgi:hypothetical protein